MDGVTDHRHFFVDEDDEERDLDRFDACAMADGSYLVYDALHDKVVARVTNWDSALELAEAFATCVKNNKR